MQNNWVFGVQPGTEGLGLRLDKAGRSAVRSAGLCFGRSVPAGRGGRARSALEGIPVLAVMRIAVDLERVRTRHSHKMGSRPSFVTANQPIAAGVARPHA